ncbi:hypothetical protein K435DRAFT_792280 [Dendrothele bispora CBS 962.96]|uniref:Uncharacterized protein n=1 Tax=Dendrothele bispora (strain CBS 962.96) TaxID=1314807 RepID=A0A4S8MJC1_DENBC|nr:hypothetical protein K435DRAFT_792280 [Dendrothele bispora CBS 962.96]
MTVAYNTNIMLNWILEIAVGSLLYGVYATLSIIAVYYLLLSKGLSLSSTNAKPRIALFASTILMLAFCTTFLVIDIDYSLIQLETVAYDPPQWDIAGLLTNTEIVANFMERMNI